MADRDPRMFHERGQALEEAFFARQEQELRERIRSQHERAEQLRALGQACGIRQEQVLEALLDMGIRSESVSALALIPIVAVAWADGRCRAAERQAVLEAAHQAGIDQQEVGSTLLESWLHVRPPDALFQAWEAYAQALAGQLDESQREAIQRDFLERARGVAETTGGILNLGPRIADEEQEILDRIEKALR